MTLPKIGQVTLILGKRGKGKTTLANKLFRKESKAVAIDFFLEYHGGTVIENLPDFEKALSEKPNKRYIIRINDYDANLDIMSLVYSQGDNTLFVEEVSRFCDKSQIAPELEKFTFWGRHRNVKIVMVAQRPAQINRHLLSQADTIITFQLTDSRDLDFIEKHFTPQDAYKVRNLNQYEFLSLTY